MGAGLPWNGDGAPPGAISPLHHGRKPIPPKPFSGDHPALGTLIVEGSPCAQPPGGTTPSPQASRRQRVSFRQARPRLLGARAAWSQASRISPKQASLVLLDRAGLQTQPVDASRSRFRTAQIR